MLQAGFAAEVHRVGRVPWVIGGDWNVRPEQVFMGNLPGFAIVASDDPTTDSGNRIDWFATNVERGDGAKVEVLSEFPIPVHRPVLAKVPRGTQGDLGVRLRRPKAFEGVTKEKLKGYVPEAGEEVVLRGSLEDMWQTWNKAAEAWLMAKEDVKGKEYVPRKGHRACLRSEHCVGPSG